MTRDVKRDVTRTTKREAGSSDRVDIALAQGDVAHDRDFILDDRLAGDTIESGVLLHEGPDENFFLAMIEPPKNVAATAIVPREYLLVIDISGSMHGHPLDIAKALLAKLIGNLRPSDTCNVAFGIASSVNRALIEGLARAGQGEPFVVAQPGDAAAQAERFRRTIDAPVLTQVKLRFERGAEGAGEFGAYIEPVAIGDLFASRPVMVFGKWKGKPSGKLIVEGLTANGNFRSTVDLPDEAKNGTSQPALRYLWARHRIASLSDQEAIEVGGVAARAITDLGLRYRLLTQYTSFVAVDRVVRKVEPDQAVPVDRPSPLPQGVANLAIGTEVPATPEAPAFAMLLVALGIVALFMRRSRSRFGRFATRVGAGA